MDQHHDNAFNAMYAVEQRDPTAAREAAAAGRGLEQRDESGATPFLKAVGSGQFVIAEILLDHGADGFAVDEFGTSAGRMIEVNPWGPGSIEGDAKQRVVAKLRARGFPFPAPSDAELEQMIQSGKWPPRGAAHGGAR